MSVSLPSKEPPSETDPDTDGEHSTDLSLPEDSELTDIPSFTNIPVDGVESETSRYSIFTNLPARRLSSQIANESRKSSDPRKSSDFGRDSWASQSDRNLSASSDSASFLPSTSQSDIGNEHPRSIDTASATLIRDIYQKVKGQLSQQSGDGPSMYVVAQLQ